MKKLLSLMLVLCMLLTGCFTLASCDGLNDQSSDTGDTTDSGTQDNATGNNDDETTVTPPDNPTPGGNQDETTGNNGDGTTVTPPDNTTPGGNQDETTGNNGDGTTVNPPDGNTTPGGDSGNTDDNDDNNDIITEETFKNMASELIANGYQTFTDNFFGNTELLQIINQAMNNGSASLVIGEGFFTGAFGWSENVPTISATLFKQSEGTTINKFASELSMLVNGETMKLNIFANKDAFAIGGNQALMGTDKTLKLNIDDLKSFLKDTLLASVISDMDPESVALIDQAIDTFTELYTMVFTAEEETVETPSFELQESDLQALVAWINACVETLRPTVTSETIDGATAYTITYTFSNETLADFANCAITECPTFVWDMIADTIVSLDGPQMTKNDLQQYVQSLFEQLDAYATFSVQPSASVAADGSLLCTSIFCHLTAKDAGSVLFTLELDLSLAFSDNALCLSADFDMDQQGSQTKETVTVTLSKTETDAKVVFSLNESVSIEIDNTNMTWNDIAKIDVTLTKSTGDYTISAVINSPTDTASDSITIQIFGTLKTVNGQDETPAKLIWTLDQIKFANITISDLGISVTFNTETETPDLPTTADDVTKYTNEQWGELGNTIESSPLAIIAESIANILNDIFGSHGNVEMMVLSGTYQDSDGNISFTFRDEDNSFCLVSFESDSPITGFYQLEGGMLLLYPDESDFEEDAIVCDFAYLDSETIVIDDMILYRV